MSKTSNSELEPAWKAWHSEESPITLGVSSCLLGQAVRYDGGHARDPFVDATLGKWVKWLPICPEVESGMSTPRPAIHLVQEDSSQTLVAKSTGEDFTERMQSYAQSKTEQLGALDGYVLKKGSPSCGLERIRVYRANGHVRSRDARGMFAKQLTDRWPLLPVEEDGRLNDPKLRENFIEQIFCRNRWRVLTQRGLTRGRLVEFHTAHKLILRAHDELGYQRLGKIVGELGTISDEQSFAQYEGEFHRALKILASRKAHTNVLQHAMGYLKELLETREKQQLLGSIEDYRLGLIPLVVPVTLLRHTISRHEIEYLQNQIYFSPHPKELMLRNHV